MNGARAGGPLVSVLVPVYNGEAFLRECIDSVLAQTYQNWKCVILDNASTDGTRAIADEFAARDARVQVHSNARLIPMLQNHNAVLRLMPPEAAYCKPLMADDWLFPECLEKMVAAAERQPAVGLVCTLAFDGRQVWWQGWPYPADRVPGRDVCRAHLLDTNFYVFGSPTSALIRADLVRRRPHFYSETTFAADYESCLDVLREADFAFVHQVLVFLRLHEKSVTSTMQDMESGFVGRLLATIRWGPHYLSQQEFQSRKEWVFSTYYDLLARHALRGSSKAFWDFHEDQFRKMGTTISKSRLSRAILRRLLRAARRPVSLCRSIVSGLHRRVTGAPHGA